MVKIFKNIFVDPYSHALRHAKKEKPNKPKIHFCKYCKHPAPPQKTTLCGKIKRLTLSIILWIPLVNTIVHLASKRFAKVPPAQQPNNEEKKEAAPEKKESVEEKKPIDSDIPLYKRLQNDGANMRVKIIYNYLPKDQKTEQNHQILADLYSNVFLGPTFYKELKNTPPNERIQRLLKAAPLLKNLEDDKAVSNIFKAVEDMNIDQSFIDKVTPWFQNLANSRDSVLVTFHALPFEEQVEKNIQPLVDFFKNIHKDPERVVDVLKNIHPTQIMTLIPQAKPYLKDIFLGDNTAEILEILSRIPDEEADAVDLVSKRYLQGINDGHEKAHLLKVLLSLPDDQVTPDNFAKIQTLFKSLPNPSKRKEIALTFDMCPPKLRKQVLTRLCDLDAPELLKKTLPAALFEMDDTIKESCYKYLEKFGLRMSYTILKNHKALLLETNHPIFQHALSNYIRRHPEALTHKDNPYALLFILQQHVATETPYNIEPQSSIIDGQAVSLNFPVLQERAKIKGYTFGMLPKGISYEWLQESLAKFDARLNGLSVEKKQKTENFILENFKSNGEQHSYAKLKFNLLDSPVIKQFMRLKGAPDQSVKASVYYLYMILQSIKDESDICSEGQLLSPREYAFLDFSRKLEFCDQGHLDGIDLQFVKLPMKYRQQQTTVSRNDEALNNIVDTSIQKQLLNTLASEELILTLVGNEVTNDQATHQTGYLKNRLHHHIGLKHQVELDELSHTIYRSLRALDLNPLMEGFLNHCTPSMLVSRLKEDVKQDLKDNGKVFSVLQRAFEKYFTDTLHLADVPSKTYQEYIKVNDDFMPEGITDKGALTLLLMSGYLKSR